MSDVKKEPLMRVKTADGKVHDVTVEELTVTNNLTYQALVTILVKKGLIEPAELLAEVERVQKERLSNAFETNG
jgi:hypothetical protein